MKRITNLILALCAILVLSGCAGAAFNKVEFAMSRNITVGQELMDLKEAHEKGVINDTEYMQAKKDILHVVGLMGELKD